MQKHKRRPLRPERLHPYSRAFHDFLLRERPGWLAYAFNVLGYHHDLFDLEIELPHPAGSKPIGRLRLPAEPIQLWMNYGEELSIDYWHWHTHSGLGKPDEHPPEEDFQEIVELVGDIMADRVVFIGKFRRSKSRGTTCVSTGDLDDELAKAHRRDDSDELIVRSWSGTLDRRVR